MKTKTIAIVAATFLGISAIGDPEHHWTGFPGVAVVILYNKNLLRDPDAVPTSVLDMMNPRFSGKACLANPLVGITSMYAAALFEALGTPFAEPFFQQSENQQNRDSFLNQ